MGESPVKKNRTKQSVPPAAAPEELYDDEVIDPEEPENMDWESSAERQPEFFERLRRRLVRTGQQRPWRHYGEEE
jgi:hypothetical protein